MSPEISTSGLCAALQSLGLLGSGLEVVVSGVAGVVLRALRDQRSADSATAASATVNAARARRLRARAGGGTVGSSRLSVDESGAVRALRIPPVPVPNSSGVAPPLASVTSA